MFRESLVSAPLSFSSPPDFLLNSLLRSHRKSGLHFLCREKVTKSGRGAPRAPVRGDSHPAGGVGPACRSIRGRIRASTGPRVERVLPKAQLQGGGRQPSPPAVRGGIWADPAPLVRMQEISLSRGPKGSLEPSTKPVAGQAGATLHSLSPQKGSRGLPGQSLATFF